MPCDLSLLDFGSSVHDSSERNPTENPAYHSNLTRRDRHQRTKNPEISIPIGRDKTISTVCSNLIIPRSWVRFPPALRCSSKIRQVLVAMVLERPIQRFRTCLTPRPPLASALREREADGVKQDGATLRRRARRHLRWFYGHRGGCHVRREPPGGVRVAHTLRRGCPWGSGGAVEAMDRLHAGCAGAEPTMAVYSPVISWQRSTTGQIAGDSGRPVFPGSSAGCAISSHHRADDRPSGWRYSVPLSTFSDNSLRNGAAYAGGVNLKVRHCFVCGCIPFEGKRTTRERGVRRERHVNRCFLGGQTDRSHRGRAN